MSCVIRVDCRKLGGCSAVQCPVVTLTSNARCFGYQNWILQSSVKMWRGVATWMCTHGFPGRENWCLRKRKWACISPRCKAVEVGSVLGQPSTRSACSLGLSVLTLGAIRSTSIGSILPTALIITSSNIYGSEESIPYNSVCLLHIPVRTTNSVEISYIGQTYYFSMNPT